MMGPRVERITSGGKLIALVIRRGKEPPGTRFHTEPALSQQLATIRYPRGKRIVAHFHKLLAKRIVTTQEVLVLTSGLLRVDLYDTAGVFLARRLLRGGDVILLAGGGHGFKALKDVRMVEVKQGPYKGPAEKKTLEPRA